MTDQVIDPPMKATDAAITFEDFLVMYAEQHAEWIDGKVIIVANNSEHNDLLSFLNALLRLFLGLSNLGKVVIAGVPMKVDRVKSGREPDLMVLLTAHISRIKTNFIDGAADIAVEIVSPESVARDYGDKFKEYAQAGVQEYWLFDEERDTVLLYVLREQDSNPMYIRQQPDERGRIMSSLLPGFFIDQAWLQVEKRPEGRAFLNLVEEMVREASA
ncbi:MAG: Uma2 family endonuclease [Chloroflexota bacterium]|nr:Uma2 family endonuclease [Chloroflexota bacterium]